MTQTKLDLKVGRAVKQSKNDAHLARLQSAMAPDPTEWEFGGYYDAGEMTETCACGHAIRHVFELVRPRDGAVIQVGSTCVATTVPWLIEHGNVKAAEDMDAARKDKKAWQKRGELRAKIAWMQEEARQWGEWFDTIRANKESGEYRFFLPPYVFAKTYQFHAKPYEHKDEQVVLRVTEKSLGKLRAEAAPLLEKYGWLIPEPPKSWKEPK